MPPVVARELSITYGALVVGGAADVHLVGRYTQTRGYAETVVGAEAVVVGATEAAFAAGCTALEAAMRTPRQRLTVRLGLATLADWDPAANSGFDAEPSAEKVGGDDDTGRSRRYRLRWTVREPADLAGQAGRQEETVAIDYSQARRRRLTLSGVYTALGNASASAQYTATINAHATAVRDALLPAIFEPIEETTTRNDTDKRLEYRRVYEELLLRQSVAAVDEPAIVGQTLTVSISESASGDAALPGLSPTRRLQQARVAYAAAVDATVTTDLAGLWRTTIRPWVLQHAATLTRTSAPAILGEEVTFDAVANTVQALLTLGVRTSSVLSAAVSVSRRLDPGVRMVPVWSSDPHARHVFLGPRTLEVSISARAQVAGAAMVGQLAAVVNQQAAALQRAGYHLVDPSTSRAEPMRLGPPGASIQVFQVEETRRLVFAAAPDATAGPSGEGLPAILGVQLGAAEGAGAAGALIGAGLTPAPPSFSVPQAFGFTL